MLEDFNRLKIKYVFSEHSNPNEDLENTVFEVIDSFFVPWLEEVFFQEYPTSTWRGENKYQIIDEFLGTDELLSLLKNEPEMFQQLFFHPKSIQAFKKRAKDVVQI
jgi:hypothetical protein